MNMKQSFLAAAMIAGTLSSGIAFADVSGRMDNEGVSCDLRAEQIIRAFFDVVDVREKSSIAGVFESDKVVITKYQSLTPGSWNQEYLVEAKIAFDRETRKYSPDQDHVVKFIMTGEYDCDGLKVKSFKDLTK